MSLAPPQQLLKIRPSIEEKNTFLVTVLKKEARLSKPQTPVLVSQVGECEKPVSIVIMEINAKTEPPRRC
jgi:hypothetical protein